MEERAGGCGISDFWGCSYDGAYYGMERSWRMSLAYNEGARRWARIDLGQRLQCPRHLEWITRYSAWYVSRYTLVVQERCSKLRRSRTHAPIKHLWPE